MNYYPAGTMANVIQTLLWKEKIGRNAFKTGRVLETIGRLDDEQRKEALLILQTYFGNRRWGKK